MGLGLGSLSRARSCNCNCPVVKGNPNPLVFEILDMRVINGLYLSEVRYLDCENYEGIKLLVTRKNPKEFVSLDPHFTNKHDLNAGLIARFEPTTDGAKMAILAMKAWEPK
jgi:hypothetical protein